MFESRIARRGFTIVELLIVIVVIAILAAITIVAYNGIQNRAKSAAAQSAAAQATKRVIAQSVIDSDQYPVDEAAFLSAINASSNPNGMYQYRVTADRKSYCLTTTVNGVSYVTSNTSQTPSAGACDGHSLDGGVVTINRSVNPSIEINPNNIGFMGGANTDSYVGRSSAWAIDGSYSFQSMKTVGAGYPKGIKVMLQDDLAIGDVIRWAVTVRNSSANSGARQFVAYGERNTPSYAGYTGGSPVSIPPGQSQRITGQLTITSANTAVAGASGFGILPTGSATFNVDEGYFVDGFVITINQPLPSGYVDGDAAGWVWDGTPDASRSRGR